jgi:hypothetical protein
VAFARYFDKAALSAASLLRGPDYAAVRELLGTHRIAVRYDTRAADTEEGRWTVELLANLLARLYPALSVAPLDAADPALGRGSEAQAREINRLLEIADPREATAAVVVGETPLRNGAPALYAGSDGWTVRLSSADPVGLGDSDVPFGAGAAACLAAAWVFRHVFRDSLPHRGALVEGDREALEVSILDLGPPRDLGPPMPDHVSLGEVHLVGLGAIGNAAAWALSRMPGISGRLCLVDGERLDLSNVQRYVLVDEADEDEVKVTLAAREWERAARPDGSRRNALEVLPHPHHWATYVSLRGDYHLDRVLLALDSAEDRIAAQASLPRWIANAWTQPENLGVSRHEFVGDGPCVACLYLPRGPRRNLDELVAEAIGAQGPEELMHVRRLLHTGEPIGADRVRALAERLGIEPEPLLPFASASLHAFYSRAVCGGILVRLGAEPGATKPAEVPMAFQSALAGILLAAELVADAGEFRLSKIPARTELDLLRPASMLALRPHSPALKDRSGRCLCVDPAFCRAYLRKYAQAGLQ